MGPTTGLPLLLLIITAVCSQCHLSLALQSSVSQHRTLSSSGSRSLDVVDGQQAAAVGGRSSLNCGVTHMGRALSAAQRRRPARAPQWGRDAEVPPPDTGRTPGTSARRTFLSNERAAVFEARQKQQDAGSAHSFVHKRRRTKRDQYMAALAAGVKSQAQPSSTVTPMNICLNKDGGPNYNMLGYHGRNFSQLNSYPYNTVVKLEIVEYNNQTGGEGNRYWCTATALSDVILVTSSHCVKPGDDPNYPDVYTIAHYGFDGKTDTAGTRVSRCIAWYDDLTEVDNAIVVIKQPMRLPKYMSYDFVNNTVPRRNAVTWMLSYPADEEEMPCLWDLGVDSPYYYGMVETRGVTPFLNYRVGRRCFIGDKYAIWAMGSMIGGQSGGCLVHDKTDNCIGTAAYSCEDASQCSSACPNAWGGFNAEFPLSDLWQSCGIR